VKLYALLQESAVGKHEVGYARVEKDFYPSPPWIVKALAEHVALAGKDVWECACGTGQMSEALKEAGASVYSSDVEDRGYAGLNKIADFLTTSPPTLRNKIIITNPPYGPRNSTAVKFAERGLMHITNGGLLALLLPNDFDSAKSRQHLFANCPMFAGKIVLTRRVKWFEPPPGQESKSPKEWHSWFCWRHKPLSSSPVLLYAPRSNGATS
jgi:hypothetical protein